MGKWFIMLPLIVLVVLTTFYTLYQVQPVVLPSTINHTQTDINGNPIVNGTSTSYEQAGNAYSITLTETLGLMAIIAVIEVIAVIAGIKVLDSGLSDVSVMIIYKTAGLTILWSILSVSGVQVLNTIPYNLGLLGYFIMTLFYTYGVISEVK